MYTDMVGYTALGQRNESLSLALVEEQRKLIRPILARHEGREVKTMGDAFLVEFPNALEGVRCAYDIQRAVREFNLSLSYEKRIHLRIGVHVGELVETQGDIAGDAVNVASRIEPLAEDGGVAITRQVHDHVQNKFELSFTSLGAKALNNVRTLVEVFRMEMPWNEEAVSSSPRLDSRRLAVLPLVNMSSDPSDSYFADGLTEELIGTLSKIRELSVISRTSVMQYKGRPKPIFEIGRELNAGTILEGSVRRAGNRARVSVQMIDAVDDKHVWAENYDRELQDIFSVQSDIATSVADALKVQLLAGERQQIGQTPTKNPEAHTLYLKAIYHGAKGSPTDLQKAIEYLELAVEQDPQFALAHAQIALNYVGIAGESMPGSEAFPKAKDNLAKALSLNPTLAEAYNVKAWIAHQYDWDWTVAETCFREAINIMPSLAKAHQLYGRFLAMLGRFEDAILEMNRAIELAPTDPFIMLHSGTVHWMAGRNDKARQFYVKALRANPGFVRAHFGLAHVSVTEGKKDVAAREADVEVPGSDHAFFRAAQAWILGSIGSTKKAMEILEYVQAGKYKGYASPFMISVIYYVLGYQDKGYEWVKRAYDERDPGFVWYNRWPILEVLRKDKRFMELLHRINLP